MFAACAAGYGKKDGSCMACSIGSFSSSPSESCSTCPLTTFADPVGAEYESYGLTFKTGLMGKETCVPRYAQQAAPTGDRLVLPAAMLTEVANYTTDGSQSAVHGAVSECVEACPADQCCIAQMQLTSDGKTLNCKHAKLDAVKPVDKDTDQAAARLYYKLPPSEMAAASTNDKNVAAKTISSGIYAVCDISAYATAATDGKIGTSYDPNLVEKEGLAGLVFGECISDAACQVACNGKSTCWGYIYVQGKGFALRGGEDQLGGRTFFSSPDAGLAAGVADIVSEWITEPMQP